MTNDFVQYSDLKLLKQLAALHCRVTVCSSTTAVSIFVTNRTCLQRLRDLKTADLELGHSSEDRTKDLRPITLKIATSGREGGII